MINYDGNLFVANEKVELPNRRRNWKCTQYYKQKCRARVTTKEGLLDVPYPEHSHPPLVIMMSDDTVKPAEEDNIINLFEIVPEAAVPVSQ